MESRVSIASTRPKSQKTGHLTFSSWLEIDLDAIEKNLKFLQEATQAQIVPILKNDAYGHGAPVLAGFLQSKGIKLIGVSSVDEALAILEHLAIKILILTPPLPEQVPHLFAEQLIYTVTSQALVEKLTALAQSRRQKLIVHLKVDTGFGRLGASTAEALSIADQIKKSPSLTLGGVFTHFPAANKNPSFTRQQLSKLLALKEQFVAHGWTNLLWHAANSSAFLNLPTSHLDFVRIGTLLYGQGLDHLAQSWQGKTRLIEVKTLPKGKSIGYGREYITKKPTLIGVIPLGYFHGLTLSPQIGILRQIKHHFAAIAQPQNYISWQGFPLPIIGRVGMGLTCLNLALAPELKVGDQVDVNMRRTTTSLVLPRLYFRKGIEICSYLNNKIYVKGHSINNLTGLFARESPLDHGFRPGQYSHFDQ